MNERAPHAGAAGRVPLARLLRAAALDLQRQSAPPLRVQARPAPGGAPAPVTVRQVPAVGGGGSGGWTPRLAWGGALACVLLLVGSTWLMVRGGAAGGGWNDLAGEPRAAHADGDTRSLRQTGFLPLVSGERWASLGSDAGAAWLVSTDLPAERLAAMGLPYDPGRAAERVRAELLLHPSGEVLAVRFVR